MTNSTTTKARNGKKVTAPVRRRALIAEPSTDAVKEVVEEKSTELTEEEIDAFEVEAAYDLLNSDNVRSVNTNPMSDTDPTVYRLEDVHAAWRSATDDRLTNVAAVRDAWNDTSDEDCCLGCLCDRFLEQTLDFITIDHRAGLIVLQGC